MARPKCYETAAKKQRAYRNRKKNLTAVPVLAEPTAMMDTTGEARGGTQQGHKRESDGSRDSRGGGQSLRDEDVGGMNCVECGGYEEHRDGCPSRRPQSESEKQRALAALRELVKVEHEKIVEEPVKPLIFRNDYGAIISERAWNQLQEKKRKAKEGGYVIDEYSQ